MADSGPHNVMCATAGANTECDCDCAGAQHAVLTTGGIPSASRVTDRAKAAARAVGNPVVENDTSGGSVQSRERPRRIPPPLLDEIRRARESLPRGRDEWDALVPRGESAYDMAVRHRDEHAARLAEEEQRAVDDDARANDRAEALERIYKQSKIRAAKRRQMIEADPDIQHYRTMAAISRDNAEKMRADTKVREYAVILADVNPKGRLGTPQLPRDGNRVEVPTADHNAHLDSIMSVGRGFMDAAEAEFARDPQLQETRRRLDTNAAIVAEWTAARTRIDETLTGQPWHEARQANRKKMQSARVAAGLPEAYDRVVDERAVNTRESQIVREMLGNARRMGGVEHGFVANPPGGGDDRGARPDAESRLRYAEQYFPEDWLAESAARPLNVTSTRRAYYSSHSDTLAMSTGDGGVSSYGGGHRDYVDEVNVHELSHRMEYTVPGLMEMEWAYVRRRTTRPDGNIETAEKMAKLTGNRAYADHEIAYKDDWAHPYTGKTYEKGGREGEHPGRNAWELMQVGTQDLFGRSKTRFDKGRGLQEFTIGVLLTLGTVR